MFGATAACRNTIRRSAVRAEAPPCGGSQNSPRGLRHESFCDLRKLCLQIYTPTEQSERCLRSSEPGESRSDDPPRREAAARATLRIAKPPKTGGKQPQRTNSFNPPAPLRCQRTAESTQTTLTRAVAPVTPGQLFSDAKIADSAAGCRYRYIFCTVATMYPGLSAHTSELRNRRSHAIRGRSIPAENRHLTATNDQKKHVATPAGGLTEKAIRHRRTKINHYLRAAYTPIKPSCSNTIS